MGIDNFIDKSLDWAAEQIVEHPFRTSAILLGAVIASTLLESENQSSASSHDAIFDSFEKQQQAEIQSIKDKIEDQKKHLSSAESYLTEADSIVTRLQEMPRREQLGAEFGKELERLAQISAQLKASEGTNHTLEATNLYWDALALDDRYQQFDRRWKAAKQEWEIRRNQVDQLIRDNTQLSFPVQTTQGTETITIDCNEWSSDALEYASRELEALEQPEDTTIDRFNHLSEQAQTLSERIAGIIAQAQTNFLSAEARLMVARIVMDTLGRRGWYPDGQDACVFSEHGDANPRLNDLILRLVNAAGDRLKFTVRRNSEYETDSGYIRLYSSLQMDMEIKDVHNRNLHALLSDVVLEALQAYGIDIRKEDSTVKGVAK